MIRLSKIMMYSELFKQFGIRYSIFRVKYELSKKLGWLKAKFPQDVLTNTYINLSTWRTNKYQKRFFLSDYNSFSRVEIGDPELTKVNAKRVLNAEVLFFFNEWKSIDWKHWNSHPLSGHEYDMGKHWSQLSIYSKTTGDIKYVWEKSKFSYLLYVARSDYKFQEDHSKFVFDEIISWINHNPPNTGPQYICSQEISIRLMNWSFLLFFYAQSPNLSEEKFNRILNSIQIQLDHVYHNINFSRIAVKNNHAVTECLALYLIPTYFPFLNQANTYKTQGLKWFVKEIKDQLYTDGSDKQFSFNYHRVKVQLLSWYIATAKANKEVIADVVLDRAELTLEFLYNMMANTEKGYLPNYGSNDGSIYFKLNDSDYRDFRPQLKALADLLGVTLEGLNEDKLSKEDSFYYTQNLVNPKRYKQIRQQKGIIYFKKGGYVLINEDQEKTLFKTPEYLDRVAQDDYFHLDIWYKGKNMLMDTGSYLYNTTPENLNYFKGVKGHNSASVNSFNHLQKGPLFTWVKKPKHIETSVTEEDDYYQVRSHMVLSYPYKHRLIRTIQKRKSSLQWTVTDEIKHMKKGDELMQNWNFNPDFKGTISVVNLSENEYSAQESKGYFSLYYGSKSELKNKSFATKASKLVTQIEITS